MGTATVGERALRPFRFTVAAGEAVNDPPFNLDAVSLAGMGTYARREDVPVAVIELWERCLASGKFRGRRQPDEHAAALRLEAMGLLNPGVAGGLG
jgi:hypothetical protein